ncbi:uncharacterized protein LOC108596014 [Drosophila busckii]|uniref:uncharacterized protein LOC108596014 n=1 Tax=Drosophila busckii TaxID=30019 RepID=UPI00083EAB22|nr:uncharacterized protein LOC108596014 [Drosophila busckii]
MELQANTTLAPPFSATLAPQFDAPLKSTQQADHVSCEQDFVYNPELHQCVPQIESRSRSSCPTGYRRDHRLDQCRRMRYDIACFCSKR